MKLHYPLVALMAMGTLAHAQVPDQGVEFSHKDWDLACNRTDECFAIGYSPGDGIDGVSLALKREAGPRTPFIGWLLFADLGGEPPTVPVRLLIDGNIVGELNQSEPKSFTLKDNQADRLVTALAGSTHIQFIDAKGQSWSLSDAGAAAVLIKMDELQERLGTPSAAIRKGNEDDDLVPGPRPRPPIIESPPLVDTRPGDRDLALDPALRKALDKALDDPLACPDLTSGDDPQPLDIQRLDDHRLLVSTRCATSTFNTVKGFWVTEDKPPYLSSLVTPAANLFDRNHAQIGAWQNFREQGDCMLRTFWRWDGKRFVMTYRAGYNRCRGFQFGGWSMPTYMN
ncbi:MULTISPECIES: DUF1176 domain-containing protein [Pseudomonas]|uniref:DUF1176 domain-containing protein n=1 Tax=Pseudomonas TaxID=286 RepID=UPI001F02CD48|nr:MULTISPECIES: DUF1176 domain-containing protein [Pseudomonas]MCG8293193.1 DUF1176 domain-containing protein [Pseudomonas entomophila]